MDDVTGSGDALDAEIRVDGAPVEDDSRAAAEARVDGARRKVEKQREHLAGAEAALAEAEAALDGGN